MIATSRLKSYSWQKNSGWCSRWRALSPSRTSICR